MPKAEKGEAPKANVPLRARTLAKSKDSDERLDDLRRRLARLNREAEMLGEAMKTKK